MKTIERRAFDYCSSCRRKRTVNKSLCRVAFSDDIRKECSCDIALEACRPPLPWRGPWQLTNMAVRGDGFQISFRPGTVLQATFEATIPPGFRKDMANEGWLINKEYRDELGFLFSNFLPLLQEAIK